MIRIACLRTLALLLLASLDLIGNAASQGQAQAPAPKANTGGAPPPAATGPAPTVSAGQTLPGVTNPRPRTATLAGDPVQTPAQQAYGVPRTPRVGTGVVDFDLTKPLTLERAIGIGLLRQNTIANAVAQTDIARASLTQARSAYFPQVVPSFQYQSSVTPSSTFITVPTTKAVADAMHVAAGGTLRATSTGTTTAAVNDSIVSENRTEVLTGSITIYDSGKREANVGYARRNVFASEYALGDTRQNVILNVTQAYYDLLRNRELVRVQEENVVLAEQTQKSIQAEVEVGAAAKSDTFQADSNLANARINLLSAQNDVRNQETTLKNAMGVIASRPLVLPDTTVPMPDLKPDSSSLDNYVQVAYKQRLDLKEQQESIYAQGYNVRLARIDNGIQVNATVSEGYQLDPNAGEERSFVVAFSYPLFDAGKTRAEVRSAKAVQEQTRRNLDILQQNARLTLEQSYNTRELARRRIEASNLAVRAGEINVQAAEEKLRNGLINILDQINAQVQLITAKVAQVQAVYDFYIADATLQRAMGQNDPGFVPDIPGNKAPKREFTRK